PMRRMDRLLAILHGIHVRYRVLTAALLALLPLTASAWDYTGHMLVDQIAYEQSTPKVRDAVSKLVESLENKYNEHKPYNFITAGTWLDDMRSDPHYTYSKLHYIDVPYTFSGTPFVEL